MSIDFLIGIAGGIAGGLAVVAGNFILYTIEIRSRTKALNKFADAIKEVSETSKKSSILAKVMPFKNPTPPTKLN